MNMFNTNSRTVMQSKLLLGLGIDPWTADLTLHEEERDIPQVIRPSMGEKTLISFHNPVDSFGETVILIIKWLFDMKLFPTQYMAKYVKKK